MAEAEDEAMRRRDGRSSRTCVNRYGCSPPAVCSADSHCSNHA